MERGGARVVKIRVKEFDPAGIGSLELEDLLKSMTTEEIEIVLSGWGVAISKDSRTSRIPDGFSAGMKAVHFVWTQRILNGGAMDPARRQALEGSDSFQEFLRAQGRERHQRIWAQYHREVKRRNSVWENWNEELERGPLWKRLVGQFQKGPEIVKPPRPRSTGYYEAEVRKELGISDFLLATVQRLGDSAK